jgi:hypothetical protein
MAGNAGSPLGRFSRNATMIVNGVEVFGMVPRRRAGYGIQQPHQRCLESGQCCFDYGGIGGGRQGLVWNEVDAALYREASMAAGGGGDAGAGNAGGWEENDTPRPVDLLRKLYSQQRSISANSIPSIQLDKDRYWLSRSNAASSQTLTHVRAGSGTDVQASSTKHVMGGVTEKSVLVPKKTIPQHHAEPSALSIREDMVLTPSLFFAATLNGKSFGTISNHHHSRTDQLFNDATSNTTEHFIPASPVQPKTYSRHPGSDKIMPFTAVPLSVITSDIAPVSPTAKLLTDDNVVQESTTAPGTDFGGYDHLRPLSASSSCSSVSKLSTGELSDDFNSEGHRNVGEFDGIESVSNAEEESKTARPPSVSIPTPTPQGDPGNVSEIATSASTPSSENQTQHSSRQSHALSQDSTASTSPSSSPSPSSSKADKTSAVTRKKVRNNFVIASTTTATAAFIAIGVLAFGVLMESRRQQIDIDFTPIARIVTRWNSIKLS